MIELNEQTLSSFRDEIEKIAAQASPSKSWSGWVPEGSGMGNRLRFGPNRGATKKMARGASKSFLGKKTLMRVGKMLNK